MKVTIEHDGKKVDVELTAEQVKELGLQEEKKKTGWERVEYNEHYYFLGNSLNDAWSGTEDNTFEDDNRYNNGNYFTDKRLAEKMNKRMSLMLRIQRWADEHNDVIDWWNEQTKKYYIYYDYEYNNLNINSVRRLRDYGQVYFSSREVAEAALVEFDKELEECYGGRYY